MDFVANKKKQVTEMLQAIGIKSIEELWADIPKDLRLTAPSDDDGLSEYEGLCHMEALAAKNDYIQFDSYLGAGAYEHHVPALVGAVCSKSEFLTSYTPYQPEVSQGVLQTMFEFQSSICAITGMDVSNASLYDGASACAEACLMGMGHNKERKKVLIAGSLHPHYRAVLDQYLGNHSIERVTLPIHPDGSLDEEAFHKHLDDDVAAVLFQYPNFFGVVEAIQEKAHAAHKVGALVVVAANPLVYGLYATAAELGADIAVGDVQPFGVSLQFGGPYCGYIACHQQFIRQMPGRIVGETVDADGRRGFVLTLQAREQHIRREKATSNICTSQGLMALASLVAMLWYGKEGIPKLALTNYQRASYLKQQLEAIPGIRATSSQPLFNEFVVAFTLPIEQVLEAFKEEGILAGIDLGKFFPDRKGELLIAVTETKSREKLDRYVVVAKKVLEGAAAR